MTRARRLWRPGSGCGDSSVLARGILREGVRLCQVTSPRRGGRSTALAVGMLSPMAHRADGIETRIRAALEWAEAEEERLLAADEGASPTDRVAASADAGAFRAARLILEEVLEPGRHSSAL